MATPALSVLIPAAGASVRLGQPKQLLEFDGQPLLKHAIDVVSGIKPAEIIIVTGAHANTVRDRVRHPAAHWIHNPNWADGLGGSIAMGAGTVNTKADGLLILLCDQYRVTENDLARLINVWQDTPGNIVAAEAGGCCMPPLIFPKSLFGELTRLTGQPGAQSLLQAHAGKLTAVAMDNARHDLDTPAQLEVLLKDRS